MTRMTLAFLKRKMEKVWLDKNKHYYNSKQRKNEKHC